jgi:hypothetical protein
MLMSQEKGRGHLDIPPPEAEMGHLAKKFGWEEKWIIEAILPLSTNNL